MLDQAALLMLLLLAAGTASVCLAMLLVARPAGTRLDLIETTIGTSIFCASVGIAFQRYGVIAGVAALAIAWMVNRVLTIRGRPQIERLCAWASAAAFLIYLAQT